MFQNIFPDRRLLIQTIGIAKSGGVIFQGLLDGLSLKELKILRNHEDLLSRLLKISKMSDAELLEIIQEDYNLLSVDLCDGNVWVDTDSLQDNIPEWFNSTHCGWHLDVQAGEFEVWARHFLAQEVRINIWIRYMEHKKKNLVKQEDPVLLGQYL